MRIILTIIFALLVGGGGAYAWIYYGGFEAEQGKAIAFIDAYGDYADVANRVDTLVHSPGTEGNTDRAELQALLESILTDTLTPERRDTLARMAFNNLDSLKNEIDSAQAAQAEVYKRLQDLDNAAKTFRGVQLRTQAEEVVTLARKRAETTARITSIQSETYEHTYAIITKILEDAGNLSDTHITAINTSTAKAGERHDTLIELYDELVASKGTLDATFASFAEVAI